MPFRDFILPLVGEFYLTGMKRLLLLFLFVTIYITSNSQSLNLGYSSGITNYFGDLGNDEFFQASSIRPGMAVTLRNLIQPSQLSGMTYSRLNLETRISWHRIGYDESQPIGARKGDQLKNYGRGLSFRSDVVGFSTHLSYTYFPNRRIPIHRQRAVMFFFAGIGIYHARPKADLFKGSIDIKNRYYAWKDGYLHDAPEESGAGNIITKDGIYETDLMNWHTEGEGYSGESYSNKKYSPWHIGFPMGFGFRYGLSKKMNLSFEFGYVKFLTDYLDDVSKAYPTYEQIRQMYPDNPLKQELAKYIADPTGQGNGGNGGPATSKRGNPKITDSYSFINIELSYNIRWHPERLKTALLSLF